MNKKQRNRKNITQNKRNRMINRRYLSTLKTLFKFFLKESNIPNEGSSVKKIELKNKLYSIIDKAVKKNVIHKNTASRKKSKISMLFKK